MNETKHTPGLWKAGGIHIQTERECVVASCYEDDCRSKDWRPEDYEECLANARLIAAAPDLLQACELVVGAERQAVAALNDAGLPCPADLGLAAEKARAALAKAESTSP